MHIGLVYIGFEQDQPGAMTGLAAQVATALAFALAVAKGPDTLALAAVQQPDASRASTTRLGWERRQFDLFGESTTMQHQGKQLCVVTMLKISA